LHITVTNIISAFTYLEFYLPIVFRQALRLQPFKIPAELQQAI
jgi:hypothetical protein